MRSFDADYEPSVAERGAGFRGRGQARQLEGRRRVGVAIVEYLFGWADMVSQVPSGQRRCHRTVTHDGSKDFKVSRLICKDDLTEVDRAVSAHHLRSIRPV